jgi:hypothetical protein
MLKYVVIAVSIAIAVFVIFKVVNRGDKQEDKTKPAPVAMGQNSSSFNNAFTKLLGDYYTLKDAFVSSDTAKANAAAAALQKSAADLEKEEIEGDSTKMIKATVQTYTSTINSSGDALRKEPDIEAKRREFEVVTDALYTLTRTVRYDGQVVYYQYCPMAFNNKGAYWLSKETRIMNPYFGDKMLHCGEVADSLDYRKKPETAEPTAD